MSWLGLLIIPSQAVAKSSLAQDQRLGNVEVERDFVTVTLDRRAGGHSELLLRQIVG